MNFQKAGDTCRGKSFTFYISMQGKLSYKVGPQYEFFKNRVDGEDRSIEFYFSANHNSE